MPAVASIVLADAQGTPVNHTFLPLGPDTNGVWWFEDQSASSAIGFNRISIQLVRPANPQPAEDSTKRMARVKIGIHTPVLENTTNSTISGIQPAPTVSYICRTAVELILPERSSPQNRKDIRKYAQFLLANALVVSVIEDLQNIY